MKGIYIEKEDAVSPVIATILMVAITVVLAATVYILVSHYTSTGTSPIAGTLTGPSENGIQATLALTYSSPSTMVPGSITIVLGSVDNTASSLTFTGFSGSTGNFSAQVTTFPTGLSLTKATIYITNPSGSGSNVQSGATITVVLIPSGTGTITWTGMTITLTYAGYSGSITQTFP